MSNWVESKVAGLVFPAPVPEPKPTKPPPSEYLVVCPRCHRPTTIGKEHESEYHYDCECGGAVVYVQWCSNRVTAIRWKQAGEFRETRPIGRQEP